MSMGLKSEELQWEGQLGAYVSTACIRAYEHAKVRSQKVYTMDYIALL